MVNNILHKILIYKLLVFEFDNGLNLAIVVVNDECSDLMTNTTAQSNNIMP